MSTRAYWGFWTLLAVVTLGLFATGTLTWFSISVVGFVSCLWIFVGMMCVTISIVGAHATEFQHHDAEPLPEKKPQRSRNSVPAGVVVQSRTAH